MSHDFPDGPDYNPEPLDDDPWEVTTSTLEAPEGMRWVLIDAPPYQPNKRWVLEPIEDKPPWKEPPMTDLQEAVHEAADLAVNPTGYADDPDETDRRAHLRDQLEAALHATIRQHLHNEGERQ